MPKVSIVMPTYNGENFLREAIESILNQTYSDWELLIVNEFGSNKDTTRILQEYANKEPRIILVQNDVRLGISASLNIGLKKATGVYIARMDADDVSLPDRLKKQVAYMEAHPEIAMCGTQVEVFGDKQFDWRVETDSEQIATDILFFSPCVHPTIMIRRDFLRENNLSYNERYIATEDFDLFSQICEKGKVANIDEILLRYRLMDGNATFRNNDIGIEIYSEILERQFSRLGLNFSKEEIELLSPHISLKGLSGSVVLEKFAELDWLLKKIYLANSQKTKYAISSLSHTLHKRYEEAYKSIEWQCKSYNRDKINQSYRHSIFSNNYFGENYLPSNTVVTPAVTVLMPTYNSEKYVMDTIDSVLRQSFSDFEFIIINEFDSNDSTVDFVHSFHDSRIKLIQNQTRLGLAESLNTGMRIAKGKYIARIDADDLCHLERLRKQVDFLEENPEYGVCGSWQHHWGLTTEWIHKTPVEHEQIKASLLYRCELCHSTLMLKKSYFVENNLFYDAQYAAEDYELWTRAVFQFKFYNIPEVLGEYRVGEGNITAKKLQDLSKEAGELAARNLKEHLGISVPENHVKYLSSWIHEFNHTIDVVSKKNHLRTEKKILKKMWNQNELLQVYERDCLLSVINQRWKWVTNDWVFGTEQDKDEPIDVLLRRKYSLIKRVRNKLGRCHPKNLLKKLLIPLYKPFKRRVCDRFDQLRQHIWDIDGHLYDYSEAIQRKILDLDCRIEMQDRQLEKLYSLLSTYVHKMDDMFSAYHKQVWKAGHDTKQAVDKRIWKAEQMINHTMNSRIWAAEQLINQTMDGRIWKAEQLINQTMDGRIWKAEQLINQTTDSRIWKAENQIWNEIVDRTNAQTWNLLYELSEKVQGQEEISQVYDFTFYLNNRFHSIISAQHVLPVIFRYVIHDRVVDFGCGTGTWLWVAQQLGTRVIKGFDGDYVPRNFLMIPESCFFPTNLEADINLNEKFDLAISMEVAEHLKESSADTFIRTLCSSANVVLFSAAHPGQGGDGHINEQPLEYWIEKFRKQEFVYIQIQKFFQDNEKIESWYRDNIALFARSGEIYEQIKNAIDNGVNTEGKAD